MHSIEIDSILRANINKCLFLAAYVRTILAPFLCNLSLSFYGINQTNNDAAATLGRFRNFFCFVFYDFCSV